MYFLVLLSRALTVAADRGRGSLEVYVSKGDDPCNIVRMHHGEWSNPPPLEIHIRDKYMCLIEVDPRPDEAKRQMKYTPRPGKRPSYKRTGVLSLGGYQEKRMEHAAILQFKSERKGNATKMHNLTLKLNNNEGGKH